MPVYADPKFMRWLAGLKPREELIMRLALRDEIRTPAASKKWNTRMLVLERIDIKTVDDWPDILRTVQRAQDEMDCVWPERKPVRH